MVADTLQELCPLWNRKISRIYGFRVITFISLYMFLFTLAYVLLTMKYKSSSIFNSLANTIQELCYIKIKKSSESMVSEFAYTMYLLWLKNGSGLLLTIIKCILYDLAYLLMEKYWSSLTLRMSATSGLRRHLEKKEEFTLYH